MIVYNAHNGHEMNRISRDVRHSLYSCTTTDYRLCYNVYT